MEDKNVLIIEYQKNFADNLSSLAYGKIIENKFNKKCFHKNITDKRNEFEKYFSNINYKSNYISANRANEIAKKAYLLSKIPTDFSKLFFKNKNSILNIKHFKIDDILHIDENIKELLSFSTLDFIKNYDILEKIQTTNSIGIFIDENENFDTHIKDFLCRATKRLNKYIKQPKLFIFTQKNIKNEINSQIDFEIVNLQDWRESFYFLTQTKYKIIPNTQHSYSQNFWATIFNTKEYFINIYDKTLNVKHSPKNWLKS